MGRHRMNVRLSASLLDDFSKARQLFIVACATSGVSGYFGLMESLLIDIWSCFGQMVRFGYLAAFRVITRHIRSCRFVNGIPPGRLFLLLGAESYE